jgi:hypothetical protein
MKTKKRQWRNILIDQNFQFRLLSYFVGLFLLTTVTLYSTTFLFFYRLKHKALDVGIPDGHIFYRFLADQKHDLDLLFLLLVLVNLLILLGVGFVVSHRIAGPILKLKNYLRDLSPASRSFNLRQGDFFRDLEPIVNSLKDKLK